MNELEAEINASEGKIYGNPDATTAPAPEVGTSPEADATPVAQPAEQPVPETDPVVVTAEEPVAPVDEGVAKPEHNVVDPDGIDWQKRFINYKASSDATIHGLRQESIYLREQLQKKDKEVQDLLIRVASVSTTDDPYKDMFSDEQRELIGEETLNAMMKVAQANADSQIKPLQEKLNATEQDRKKAEADRLKADKVRLHNEFLAKLEIAVPGYKTIDTNSNFLAWMEQPDEVAGVQRKALFLRAQSAGDVQRVAEFFLKFQELNTPADKLAAKVAPTNSTGGAPSVNTDAPVITPAFIDKFYENSRKGLFKGKEKEQQEIEKMIDDHIRSLAGNR
jgi:hypothetical protein